jgi:hypothetical protein
MTDISNSDISGCYYKGVALDFKAKQKEDRELEAYLRESMKKYCERPFEDWSDRFDLSNNSTSDYTEDCYYEEMPPEKTTGNCILDLVNSLCCAFVFWGEKRSFLS